MKKILTFFSALLLTVTLNSFAAGITNGVAYYGGSGSGPQTTAAGTTGQILIGTTSSPPSWLTAGTTGQILLGVTSASPSWLTAGTTGQLLIGSTSAAPAWGTTIGASLQISKATVGGTTFFDVGNSNNTNTGSDARVGVNTQASGGSPYFNWSRGGTAFSFGMDALDSSNLKLTNQTNPSSGTVSLLINPTTSQVTLPAQSNFFVYKDSDTTNATGDGTEYTVIYNQTIQNVGSNYNAATGIYTTPTTGWFNFYGSITVGAIGVGHTQGYVRLLVNGTDFYLGQQLNPGTVKTIGNEVTFTYAFHVYLASSSTVQTKVTLANSTKTITVRGNASPIFITYFSGGLEH